MRGRALTILVIWAGMVIPGMLSRGFWNPDEGRYGEVAREVWQGNGAVVLTLADRPYAEKPPLFYWCVAAAQMLGGANAPASRIPSALATLATAFLLFSLVRRTHGEDEAFFSALLLLSSELVFQMAGWVGIDAMAMLTVTLAVWAQDRALGAGGRAGRYRLLMYLAVAAVILTKGAPVIIAILALAGRAWLDRGWRGLLPRHLLWGVPLVVGVAAAWAVPAGLVGGWGHIWEMTGGQAGRRLVDASSHRHPFWYYLGRFPAHFLPVTVLLPAAVLLAWRELRAGGPRRRATGLYVLWFVLPFLLFSAISGKRERYILPIFPAAAALVGIAAVRYAVGPLSRRLVHLPLKAALGVLALGGLALAVFPFVFGPFVVPHLRDVDPSIALEMRTAASGSLAILVLGGLSATAAALDGILRRRIEPPVLPLAAATGFLVLTLGAGILPIMDRAKNADYFVERARAAAPADARWGTLKLDPGAFCLALDTADVAVFDEDEGRPFRRAAAALKSEPHLVLIAEAWAMSVIEKTPGLDLEIVATRGVGRRHLVAFRARRAN